MSSHLNPINKILGGYMGKFQVLCSCIKCKNVTTTSQLTRNHSDKCPKERSPTRFPKNFGRPAWNKGIKTTVDKRNPELMGKHGGYRPNAGRSKKVKVYDSNGKLVTLQSSYENAVFEILCELGINWIRPSALKYDGRNYFADFYLPDYDIWLDPKNDFKAKHDEEKISKVIKQNNVRLYVMLRRNISKQFLVEILYNS
jgi:hypothetical protein